MNRAAPGGPAPHGAAAGGAARHDEPARHERVRARDSRVARLYGARPWHLLAVGALLLATAYVVGLLRADPALPRIAAWFVGAAVAWDLVLGPLLALADRGLRAALGGVRAAGVRPLNYVRAPLLVSAALLLVSAPLVLQRSEGVYRAKTGLLQDPYLGRWLAVTGALCAASALLLGLAVLRARRRQ